MSKNNNILELNGKKYDARTGAVLSHAKSTAQPVKHTVSRKPAQHAKPHSPKASRTLMRHAVKKPKAPKNSVAKTTSAIAPKRSVHQLHPRRAHDAAKIGQSKLISHFRPVQPTVYTATTRAQQPAPSTAQAPAAIHHRPKKAKTTADLLEHALKHANSHEQPAPKHHKRRGKHLASIGAAAALVAIVIGVTVSQNVPELRLQMASSKAGFDVSMPTYQPAGYSLGELAYSSGVATTNFTSNSDQRSYTLTQKPTDWNSMALRDLFVVTNDPYFETVEIGPRSLYIYGNSNATWISDGMWYTIQSDGSLSHKQLIDLAASL